MGIKYDLVVIGGGSGGLSAAAGAARFGAKVALVEKHKLGGECLWTGCVPSKALIKSAKVAHLINNAEAFGLEKQKVVVKLEKVMAHVENVIKKIEPHDSPGRFKSLGVDVFFGSPSFKDKNTLMVNGQELRAKSFIIATGSQPFRLPVPGLEEVGYLKNEILFEKRVLPKTLLVIGGGPIGVEMAQAFRRLGSEVVIFERGSHLLGKEDADVALVLEGVFEREGIKILKDLELVKVEKKERKKIVHITQKGKKMSVGGDEILLAVGRTPNVEGLNLDVIGVKYDKRKIFVNDRLQTSVSNIYAVGDVKGKFLFTHMAGYEAGVALTNILFKLPVKADYGVVPWTTFTDPEIARVGFSEQELKERNVSCSVLKYPLEDVDRAQTDMEAVGFVKLLVDKSARILGAHIVGANAGEMLPEFVLAMKKKLKVTDIFRTIHVYPTLGMANQLVAGKFYEKKLTERVKRLLQVVFGFGSK